ncbi:MAG: histidine--tRNA ligase, partial [Thermoguttaceae bacterium]
MITPRTLKGFRDDLPDVMMIREKIIDQARHVFRSFGFCPIDTPALEYLEILSGKGSDETDKQLYKFEDHGGRAVGLRFDLTVPFARFAAQHIGSLGTPFKRYHIAKVWRGENTQSGRYREFMQCDFDTIGTNSVAADIEIALMINCLLETILDCKTSGETACGFTIRINNRKVLSGLLEKLNLSDKSVLVLRALDKLPKIGREKVAAEMVEFAGASQEQADAVLKLAELTNGHGDTKQISNESVLESLREMLSGNSLGEKGISELDFLLRSLREAGVTDGRVVIDVSIARGLDYYTGTIYETFLNELPQIGSVCSGGRYDNLAGLYTKQELPGVGASLGLDRLLAALEQLNRIEKAATPASVFIPYFVESLYGEYLKLATNLRQNGIGVEVYPEFKKLGVQLKYADRK